MLGGSTVKLFPRSDIFSIVKITITKLGSGHGNAAMKEPLMQKIRGSELITRTKTEKHIVLTRGEQTGKARN